MIYVVGITSRNRPVFLRAWARAEAFADKQIKIPTSGLYSRGIFVHEAFGKKDAAEVASIRRWAEDMAGTPDLVLCGDGDCQVPSSTSRR
jgi:hypothetical protein